MTRQSGAALTLVLIGLLFFVPVTEAFAFSNGQAASIVLGQTDFATGTGGTTASKMCCPHGIAFDSSGNLWVADQDNHRVLRFEAPFTTGDAASLVLGQTDFTTDTSGTTATKMFSPDDLAFDSAGNLWVADGDNERILRFEAPFTTGQAATLVLGQSDFTTGRYGLSASKMDSPIGLAFDSSGNLWVADEDNNRVLRFEAPFTTGDAASLVLGQPDFTTYRSGTTSSKMLLPSGLAFDSAGNLWVADEGNERILRFEAPFTTGDAATLVLGQPDFTTDTSGTTSSKMDSPTKSAFDSSGDLVVTDQANNRVLRFDAPFTTGQAATLVLGQSDFTTGRYGLSASKMDSPIGIAFDSSGNLWVADRDNSRVLEFFPLNDSTPVTTPPAQVTTPPPPPTSGCLIATAAYGSELTPQVQYLRNFRENYILSTAAGSAFMGTFNSIYYSFSPQVADYERGQPWLQSVVRTGLYPLFGILTLSEKAHFGVGGGELGAVSSGAVAGMLIGALYLWPAALSTRIQNRLAAANKILVVLLSLSVLATVIGLISSNSSLLSVSTPIFVLTLAATGALATGWVVRLVKGRITKSRL